MNEVDHSLCAYLCSWQIVAMVALVVQGVSGGVVNVLGERHLVGCGCGGGGGDGDGGAGYCGCGDGGSGDSDWQGDLPSQ